MKIVVRLILLVMIFPLTPVWGQDHVKNVILFIGDGMGYGQIEASSQYFYGQNGSLSFEKLPVRGEISTHSASNEVTDSAAAATAIATGQKTNNGYVGRDSKARDIPNILEIVKYAGKVTGIVTTVSISHATPAGFAAHEDHREKKNGIVDSMLSDTRPHLLLGATTEINPDWARFKSYQVVTNLGELKAIPSSSVAPYVSGQFGKDELPWESQSFGDLPRLREMTREALRLLEGHPHGFFLVVEGGKIDWASHHGDLFKTVHEVKGLADAVDEVLTWMKDRNDTLLIVTADHETGGLELTKANGRKQLPSHRWTSPRGGDGTLTHTAQKVPLFAKGSGEAEFSGTYDNTDIFHKLIDLQGQREIYRVLAPQSY